MNRYLSILIVHTLWFLIAGGLFYWGFLNEGWIRITLAVLIFYFTVASMRSDINYAIDFSRWLKRNEGNYILFYPTKKNIQDKIKSDFIPKIPFRVMEVYYDGPKVIGDIKRSIVFELMSRHQGIQIHKPSFIRVHDNLLEVLELEILSKINKEEIDYQILLDKIHDFIRPDNE